MSERIEKKIEQIKKKENLLNKYGAKLNEEQKANALSLKWMELNEYCGRNFDLHDAMEGYRRTYNDLATLKVQLEKIQKQEEVKKAKEDTLNDMPEALKEFGEKVVKAWNEYDIGLREFYKKKYDELEAKYPVNSIQGYKDFIKQYKYGAYQMMHTPDCDFDKENRKNMERLILNLLDRVTERTGKITDASGLVVTTGNQGYAVINGFIIGEKGRCEVESIGAGGYNIQKYHIRTLVK